MDRNDAMGRAAKAMELGRLSPEEEALLPHVRSMGRAMDRAIDVIAPRGPTPSDLLAFLDGQRAYVQFDRKISKPGEYPRDGKGAGAISFTEKNGWEVHVVTEDGGQLKWINDDRICATFREAVDLYQSTLASLPL